jgi:hypothetical protein
MPMRRQMSCQPQATHHYLENSKNKTIFAGRIEIDGRNQRLSHTLGGPYQGREGVARLLERRYAGHLGALSCVQQGARGMLLVPAGFLLGFMRRWRTSPDSAAKPNVLAVPKRSTPEELELHRLIAAAPSKNWQFHASDLCKLIGQAAYEPARLKTFILTDSSSRGMYFA